jgi:hypothetical protein
MDVRLVHNCELWNGFIAQQLGQYSYQTFEWGEYLNGKGHIIFRLGAFAEGQLVGVMLLAITRASLSAPFSLLNLKWMYCYQGPCITEEHPEALGALLAEAHAIAKREQTIMMRIEAPHLRDKDAYLWHCTLQRLQYGLRGYASDWAKAQGLSRYDMYVISPDQRKLAIISGRQANDSNNGAHVLERTAKTLLDRREGEGSDPIYDFVYRPFFYQLWTFISHGHLPSSTQSFQQMQRQVANAATVPLHA